MIEAQQITVAQALGELAWNLAERTEYTAGQPLPVEIAVANPTAAEREYSLSMALYDPTTREVLTGTAAWVMVEEARSFKVGAGKYLTLKGSLTLDRSDVILGITLSDFSTMETLASVFTQLASPWQNILGVIGPVLALGLVAAILPAMTKMVKKE